MSIVKKHGEPWIKVSPHGKQEEPESLVAIKAEIERRWGTIDLLDILIRYRFHRRVHLGRHQREPVQGRTAAPAAAGPVRPGHQHGHQARRGHR
ncbi:hypothetical protein ACIRD2_34170 [Streptomyces sp. NPDC093595]|uniref:hypothetical protein n=1 Tax=Streptomyces sp. NPDC093595 TaxID=3366045 RepID=UPI0038295659